MGIVGIGGVKDEMNDDDDVDDDDTSDDSVLTREDAVQSLKNIDRYPQRTAVPRSMSSTHRPPLSSASSSPHPYPHPSHPSTTLHPPPSPASPYTK